MNKDYFPIPDTSGMEPLTMEQYNALDGRPVIVERNTMKKWWAIAQRLGSDTHGYGRFWWAYAYPPAHIDREEWKPCWLCSISSGEPAKHLILPETCNGEAKYCPECGRPLTSEAWAMLEKRLRGVRAWQNVVI